MKRFRIALVVDGDVNADYELDLLVSGDELTLVAPGESIMLRTKKMEVPWKCIDDVGVVTMTAEVLD